MFGSQTQTGPKEDDPDAGITSIDYEEQTAGYQVAYSKLAASEVARPDPVAYAGDTKQYLFKQLSEAVRRSGGDTWKSFIAQSDPGSAAAFVQEYNAAGFSF
jgi:exportin-2 (importin alpha re-exporter)